jgi:hypothetical protein
MDMDTTQLLALAAALLGQAACGCTRWCFSPGWPVARLGRAAAGLQLLQRPLLLGASGLMLTAGILRRQDSGAGYAVGRGADLHPHSAGARAAAVFGGDQISWARSPR